MRQTGLIFASGGGLGSYDVGVIKRLVEQNPDFRPDVVTGISMGAIQAALLAGGRHNNTLDTLDTFWERLSRLSAPVLPPRLDDAIALIGSPNFYRMRADYWMAPFWTGFYTNDMFSRLLSELIDLDKLNRSSIQVIIPSINISTSDIHYFTNRGPDRTRITLDHLMANASLPIPFSFVEIRGGRYWDGAYFDHCPFARLIQQFDPDPAVGKRLIVSSLYPKYDTLPMNMIEVYLRMIRLTVTNKIETAVMQTSRLNQVRAFMGMLDETLPKNSKIRKHPQFKALLQQPFLHQFEFIHSTDTNLCSGTITRHKTRERMEAGYRDAGRILQSSPSR